MKLTVFMTLPDGQQVRTGTLDFGEILRGGRYQTSFEYAKEWLNHSSFFPLDPESLDPGDNKTKNRHIFEAQRLTPPLSVFSDSLPDDWGRRLLVTQRQLTGVSQEDPYLLKEMGASSLGALSFFEPGAKPARKTDCTEQVARLDELLEAAERFEQGDRSIDPAMLRLLSTGGTPWRCEAESAGSVGRWAVDRKISQQAERRRHRCGRS